MLNGSGELKCRREREPEKRDEGEALVGPASIENESWT